MSETKNAPACDDCLRVHCLCGDTTEELSFEESDEEEWPPAPVSLDQLDTMMEMYAAQMGRQDELSSKLQYLNEERRNHTLALENQGAVILQQGRKIAELQHQVGALLANASAASSGLSTTQMRDGSGPSL